MTAHDAVEAGARALAGWYHGTDARWCAYQREARCAITAAEPILTGPLRQRIAECDAVIAEEQRQALERDVELARMAQRLAVADEVIRSCLYAANHALSGWSKSSADGLFSASAGATAWLASKAEEGER